MWGTQSHPPAGNPLLKYFQDPPALIAILGVTGSGKTTFVNQLTTSSLLVGDGLESCTSEVQVSEEFMLDGRRVALIDTPGFDDTNRNDADVLKSIAVFLGEVYSAGVKLAGVVYVHRISDIRFGGSATKNFRMLKELCGENTLKNVVLVTNMWGMVAPKKGAAREKELRNGYFKAAIDKGAQLRRHNGSPESAREILRNILRNQPIVLKIQRELIDERKNIGQTGAGVELSRDMIDVIERYQRNIKELEESRQKAVREKDEELRREFAEEKQRAQQEMEKLKRERVQIQFKLAAAQREMEERIKKIQEAYEARIRGYEDRVKELEREGSRNGDEIEVLKRSVEDLKERLDSRWSCVVM